MLILANIGCAFPDCSCEVPTDNWSNDKRHSFCKKFQLHYRCYQCGQPFDLCLCNDNKYAQRKDNS